MKKCFMFIVLFLLGIFLVGCDTNSKELNEELDTNGTIVEMTKNVINIDNTNYSDYFDIDNENMVTSISGAIDFAIYDNCVVKYSYLNPKSNSTTITEAKLNKGGNLKVFAPDFRIIEITGTVTYWF